MLDENLKAARESLESIKEMFNDQLSKQGRSTRNASDTFAAVDTVILLGILSTNIALMKGINELIKQGASDES